MPIIRTSSNRLCGNIGNSYINGPSIGKYPSGS